MKSKIHTIRITQSCPERSRRDAIRTFRQENNQKGRFSNEKSTKIAAAFIQNKPNFKNIKIGVSSFETSKYEILPAWRVEKTNPIKPNFILDVSSLAFLSGDKPNLYSCRPVFLQL